MISTTAIKDPDTRRAVEALSLQLDEVLRRLNAIQRSNEGPVSSLLPSTVKKSTASGPKTVPAVDEVAANIGGEGVDELQAAKVKYADATAVEDLQPAEAGAEVTAGKSLTVLSDRLAANIAYADTTPVESLKPAEAGAEATAGKSLTLLIDREAANIAYGGGASVESLKPAEAGANITETRTAAAIAGQGALATKNAVDLATSEVANKKAANITFAAGQTVESLKPAQAGADVTGSNQAASIAGQGAFATKSAIDDPTQIPTNMVRRVAIQDAAINAAKVADAAIETAKLANGAVTNTKMGVTAAWTPSNASEPVARLYNAVREIQDKIDAEFGWTPSKPVSDGVPES